MEITSMTLYFVVIILLFSFFITTVIWRKIKKYSPFWEDFGKIITIITAILFLSVIYIELKELRNQNEYTELSLRQSYRPLGVVGLGEKEKLYSSLLIDSTYVFYLNRKIINKGKGILFYIGTIRFITDKEINFYSKSFLQNIKESNIVIDSNSFDKVFSLLRFNPRLPEEDISIDINWFNVNSRREYYFYCIYLYKDQNHNLYDTIQLYYYRFKNSYTLGEKEELQLTNYFYNTYSKEEQNELAKEIEPYHPSMADYIRYKD